MSLLAGTRLNPRALFEGDAGINRGSSVDLTIGEILDTSGKNVGSQYLLQPGHMVLVVSKQVFKLPDNVTGHVTYKTTLTRKGIWGLTVGIVDPGWDGPIATSILNFSSRPYLVETDAEFLRVTFFDHERVPPEQLRSCGGLDHYMRELRALSASQFPVTFLDQERIADSAKKQALEEMRRQAAFWVAGISLLFTALALLTQWIDRQFISHDFVITADDALHNVRDEAAAARADAGRNQTEIDNLRRRVEGLEGRATPPQRRSTNSASH